MDMHTAHTLQCTNSYAILSYLSRPAHPGYKIAPLLPELISLCLEMSGKQHLLPGPGSSDWQGMYVGQIKITLQDRIVEQKWLQDLVFLFCLLNIDLVNKLHIYYQLGTVIIAQHFMQRCLYLSLIPLIGVHLWNAWRAGCSPPPLLMMSSMELFFQK